MEDNKTKEEDLSLLEVEALLLEFYSKNKAGKGAGYPCRLIKQFAEQFSQQSTKHLQDRVKELESWKFQARNIMYDLWAELQNTGYSSSKAELIAKTNAFMNPDLLNTKS